MDVILLSRLQSALTIMFHYLFPPLTIGMGVVLVFLGAQYLRTKKPIYRQAQKFWTRIFALNFAIGVATGITMEFQSGTNWAEFARFVGPYVISLLLTQVQEGTVTWESGWPLVLAYGLSQFLGQVVGWRIALFAAWSFEVMAMKRLYVHESRYDEVVERIRPEATAPARSARAAPAREIANSRPHTVLPNIKFSLYSPRIAFTPEESKKHRDTRQHHQPSPHHSPPQETWRHTKVILYRVLGMGGMEEGKDNRRSIELEK